MHCEQILGCQPVNQATLRARPLTLHCQPAAPLSDYLVTVPKACDLTHYETLSTLGMHAKYISQSHWGPCSQETLLAMSHLSLSRIDLKRFCNGLCSAYSCVFNAASKSSKTLVTCFTKIRCA